jgi:raffinose/stachyose/melibiose transport system substrate-binding protein
MEENMGRVKTFILAGLMLFVVIGLAFAEGGQQPGGAGANKLELWSIQTDGNGPEIYQRAITRFRKDNPGIKVNLTLIANDSYKQKLAVALASGQAPDCFLSWGGGPMQEFVKNNQIADLTPYMDYNNYKAKFLDAAITQATYQEKIWGVPVNNVAVGVIFYNKELFARYKLTEPTTIRELEAACDTLKKNNIFPFALANKTQWTGSIFFTCLATRRGGTQPFIKAVDGSGSFTDPAFIYAGEKIQEWVKKGYFITGFNGLDWDAGQARTTLYRGEAAMVLMGSWFNMQALSENPAFYAKMGFFKFPRDEQGTGNPDTAFGTIGDNFYHVSASSKNQLKAFELITHLIDDEAVKDAVADGRIPPVKGVTLKDKNLTELSAMAQKAQELVLWYDQSLSFEVSEVHKRTSQQIFGNTLTPRAAAEKLQEAQAAYLKKK